MYKINVLFNDENYNVDEELLSKYASMIKSHITNNMNGTGATIKFGGSSYNIDSTKLSTARNDFTSYLGTISGNGEKVVINGVQYSVDSAKLSESVSEIEAILNGLHSDNGDSGLTNEYGFYYDTKYSKYSESEGITTLYFRENQTGEVYINDQLYLTLPLVYGQKNIVTVPNYGDITFYSDGNMLEASFLGTFKLGECVIEENDYRYVFMYLNNDLGWEATVTDKTKTTYGELRGEIDGHPVLLSSTFGDCYNLITAPEIPYGIISMHAAFWNCSNLTGNITINANPTSYVNCFKGTEKPITIIGSCPTETKAGLAATANEGNVSY